MRYELLVKAQLVMVVHPSYPRTWEAEIRGLKQVQSLALICSQSKFQVRQGPSEILSQNKKQGCIELIPDPGGLQ